MSALQRLDIEEIDPAAHQAVLAMERYIHSGSLEEELINLIKLRASQLNGCAFCLDMHTREAVAQGETLRRLAVLSAWREAPNLYTARERAAVALTEAVIPHSPTAPRERRMLSRLRRHKTACF